MVAPPKILNYSIIMHQVINAFESYTSWLLNLFLKWFICGNGYLTFYSNVEMITENFNKKYEEQRKSRWYVNVYANLGRSAF